nr:FG-GAP repeat protein [Pseudomonadota bacterium]
MKGFTRIRIHGASVGLVTILLTACGGGGGGGTTSPTPAPPPPPSPPSATAAEIDPVSVKTLRFTWPDVSDATHYRLLENPDNSSGFAQVGSDVAQGVGVIDHVIPLYARLNAQYILQSCNTAGCTDSSAMGITKSLTPAIGYVKASNADADDRFGHAVSLSADGRTLAISARTEDSGTTGVDGNQSDNSAPLSGAVYVFVRVGNVWSQQAYLKASNTETLEQFGLVVSLSADGNTLAVGSPGENSNASGIDGDQSDNSAGNSGAVYVFSRSGDVWSQQVYVKASNTDSGDQFGMAVGLSADGNTLAVGASLESSGATGIDGNQGDNSVSESGAVYVFGRTGDVWSQDAYVKASNPDSGDRFGIALGLSADGNTLAVGASSEESNATGVGGDQGDNSLIAPGAVYVFNRAANVWSQQAYVKASNTDSLDQFGRVVDLSADGNTMAVSARNESSGDPGIDGNQNDNDSDAAGAVYVFNRSGSNWLQQAYLKASNVDVGDLFGRAISLSEDGDTLA